MITLYGIPNCDTVRKARKWLTENEIDYQFHNFKKEGLEQRLLEKWVDILGWEVLLNKRGTTWRKLPDEIKADINQDKAIQIMLEATSIIKRPILDNNGALSVGFKDALYQSLFQ
ncbi:MAG: ArsC family reductase [gamma proteobacterium symbiont of Bathyaustriella thionipta]|nr:ArsC family reductase [gamma proteobacterium symbiont of Bathyaustriella thionipta]MCU7948594.1 ArsC family reductase [gamma proteobacterium symbiont of Bathyaustriella thionipta]MCU7953285.1 ArsC family reductase [gamma proteobacterium symbiont of Bathyaustriella thionipta]MCU7955100.1 ArsC family reductase [gamma proteobacterium symbiont of Bathyaustriella thionipta]MCU7968277.1 ArsC family reductase [gamma proteobacterium symbiont of Bathyaustriella thionipta]